MDPSIPFDMEVVTKILTDFLFGHVQIENPVAKEDMEQTIFPIDKDCGSTDSLLRELENLTGLQEVKKEVSSIINLLKLQKIRKERGLPELPGILYFLAIPAQAKQQLPDCWHKFTTNWESFLKVS